MPESDDEEEEVKFLLDAVALEQCMSDGSAADHKALSNSTYKIFSTSQIKEDFYEVFPDEHLFISKIVKTAPIQKKDEMLSGTIADQLQNQFDVDDSAIQDKLLLIALARRIGARLVTGDTFPIETSLESLCENQPVACITVKVFIAIIS